MTNDIYIRLTNDISIRKTVIRHTNDSVTTSESFNIDFTINSSHLIAVNANIDTENINSNIDRTINSPNLLAITLTLL